MASLPEINEFTEGVYQIETSDPVLGGVDGTTNVPLKALANRTRWLKGQVEALESAVASAIDANYVQGELNKLANKEPVRAVTTTNITLSGLQTIDGVSLLAGDRVLVRSQSTAAQNGIYVAQTSAWVRAADLDENTEIRAGVKVVVTAGSIFADTIWLLATDGTITVGTTAQAWQCLTFDTALLGNPTAVTQAQFNDSTRLATTAFVQRALGNLSGFRVGANGNTLTAADAGKQVNMNNASTVTLPLLSAVTPGTAFFFVSSGSGGARTVQRQGSDQFAISGLGTSNSITIEDGGFAIITSNGGFWNVLSSKAGFEGNAVSLAGNGYQRLPSGLIIQWTTATSGATGTQVNTLPIAFPNANLKWVGIAAGTSRVVSFGGASNTSVTVNCFLSTTGALLPNENILIIAIGH